jgi:2-polyprenyl-3-methyl-5-hydroxy-6-metoxy-1,4-benzoquinol methylase
MPMLYGEIKSDAEIRDHVISYVKSVSTSKHDRFQPIMSLIPANCGNVLDYGCGWGHYAIAIRDKGNTVEAIDLSANEIDICKLVWGEQAGINFNLASIDQFPSNNFDCVLSSQVIEHVHNAGTYLSSINRVLKPNGRLVISLPNIMNPRFFLTLLRSEMEQRLRTHSKNILENYDKTQDHINAWDPQHFTTLLASVGFLLENYIPTEGIPFPMRWPFKSYVYLRNKRLANLSYTMTFAFRKVKTVNVRPEE